MLRAREAVEPERFTFHSSRMRMKQVTKVGCHDPMKLTRIYRDLKRDGIDALVLSSCVQMQSLAAVPIVEKECGIPVISASICTTHQMLQRLGLKTHVPNAGSLLSGKY